MTIEVANTASINTFQFLVNRVNELAYAMSANAVTTDSNTALGNAAITGAFTANVLIANTVRVSNSTSNVVIVVPNTTMVSNGNYYLNANGNWTLLKPIVTSVSINTASFVPQEIDNYRMTENGGAEYFIRVKDNNANGYQASKVLTFHNLVNAFSTEYGSMVSNASLGAFYVTTNTSHVVLWMVPTSSNTAVNMSRVNF
jgi:hypothetical protein